MELSLLTDLVNRALSVRKISKSTGMSYTTVRYWLKKYNLVTKGIKKPALSREDFQKSVEGSECISDIIKKLGLKVRPGNYATMHKYSIMYDISLPAYKNNRGNRWGKNYTDDEIFTENSLIARHSVKNRFKKITIYKCNICGQDENWMGKKLSLILDHKNGINNDNRRENLRFLCPNCNATLDTHCGKNLKK